MLGLVSRLADGMLTRLLPRAEAAACSEYWVTCFCDAERIVWQKKCGGGCNGIPHYCRSCQSRALRC